MSSFKNALKTKQKTHRERSQVGVSSFLLIIISSTLFLIKHVGDNLASLFYLCTDNNVVHPIQVPSSTPGRELQKVVVVRAVIVKYAF